MKAMGITDPQRIYTERDLAPGPDIIFAACGVTDGNFMRGVRFFGHGLRTSSLIMSLQRPDDPLRRLRAAGRHARRRRRVLGGRADQRPSAALLRSFACAA